MRRTLLATLAGVAIGMTTLAVLPGRPAVADDDAPVAAGPAGLIDRVMADVGRGQIDDAVTLMDGLRADADRKAAARSALLAVRDGGLGDYHGYDVAAAVKFSPRLQTLDVLGYFEQQPVLYRFELYQPADHGGWTVLDLRVEPHLDAAAELMREDKGLASRRSATVVVPKQE